MLPLHARQAMHSTDIRYALPVSYNPLSTNDVFTPTTPEPSSSGGTTCPILLRAWYAIASADVARTVLQYPGAAMSGMQPRDHVYGTDVADAALSFGALREHTHIHSPPQSICSALPR
eukprot:1483750-Rhodomonas_salina.3